MVSIVGLFALAFAWPVFGADIDLKSATVVPVSGATRPEQKAAQMLVEEVEKRTQIRMPQGASGKPVIRLLRAAAGGKAEGYRLRTTPTEIVIEGNDSRGVLFGVGHFLRLARMSRQSFSIAAGVNIETAPQTGLRGHQLGYRPKTNSYDAWTLPMWEQYIRELAVFGTNAIELIPPRSDDDDDSPHFPLPKIDTMAGMSKIIDDYGLDVWIWYPALDADYSKPETVEFALKEWAEVFRRLPRIDHVFVPGGDPGHTSPQYLMPLLEKQTANLRKYHPKAKMWVAPQGFSQEWLDEFIGMLRKEPAWLEGIVFGPQNRVSLPKLREMVPKRFPIRHYPDITHTIRAQYPVPEWDVAYALTLGREPVNPRPHDMRAIFRLLQSYTNGFLTYSEGCNDDVNKIVWSALGWNRDADLMSVLREYSQFFIGPEFRDGFAQGLLALEQNWRGPLLGNASVNATLEQFQAMERTATPQQLLNWRFQQGLYRAYYDAYIRARLIHETEAEQRAMEALRSHGVEGIPVAERILDEAAAHFPTATLRNRTFELAEALFQSIRMQLSVTKYKAIAVGRGANLDAIDTPLNNRAWLKGRFAEIARMAKPADRAAAVREIVHWTDAGPGGYYDDLGNPALQPHLDRGLPFDQDPARLVSSMTGFAINPDTEIAPWRMSWLQYAGTMNDNSVSVVYPNLDPTARYKVKIVYAGETQNFDIRLVADGQYEVHPLRPKDRPVRPVEFDIPQQATTDGKLTLTWERKAGLGGNGRGVQISEVWLIRK